MEEVTIVIVLGQPPGSCSASKDASSVEPSAMIGTVISANSIVDATPNPGVI